METGDDIICVVRRIGKRQGLAACGVASISVFVCSVAAIPEESSFAKKNHFYIDWMISFLEKH